MVNSASEGEGRPLVAAAVGHRAVLPEGPKVYGMLASTFSSGLHCVGSGRNACTPYAIDPIAQSGHASDSLQLIHSPLHAAKGCWLQCDHGRRSCLAGLVRLVPTPRR
jgi:hypothetical protein